MARWRTALFSVGLLAEALGLSSTQRSGGLPLAATWTLLSDAELYAALERGRRGGTSPAGALDDAAGVRAFLAVAHACIARTAVAAAGAPPSKGAAPPRAAPAAVRAGPAPRGPHPNPFHVLADGLDF